MIRRISAAATALALVASATLVMARTDITVQKDPKFDFTKLNTFGWNANPGEVKIIVSLEAEKKAEPAKRTYEPVLMQAVTDEMTRRGYTAAAGAAPDFQLIYYVLITQGSVSQHMGQFLPTNATWGLPLWNSNTTAFKVYTEGAIVVDAYSPPGTLVWRGMAAAKVDVMKTEEERGARIRQAMKDLIAKFPKRGAK